MQRSMFIFSIAAVLATAAYAGCTVEKAADDDDGGGFGSGTGGSASTPTSSTATGVGPTQSSSPASSTAAASTGSGAPTKIDDCVCPDCQVASNPGATFCVENNGCDNNGQCDPFNEGCGCADCAAHSYCSGGGAGGGAAGAGGGGGAAPTTGSGGLQCSLSADCPNPDQGVCLCVGCIDDGVCEE